MSRGGSKGTVLTLKVAPVISWLPQELGCLPTFLPACSPGCQSYLHPTAPLPLGELAADTGAAAAVLSIPLGMMSPNEGPQEINIEYKNLAANRGWD